MTSKDKNVSDIAALKALFGPIMDNSPAPGMGLAEAWEEIGKGRFE
jgi:hypothetical protein